MRFACLIFQLAEVEIEFVNLIHQAIACILQSSRNFAVQCVKSINYIGLVLTSRCIVRLDELGQTFVVRLVMRVMYKDGHKRHPSKRMIFVVRLETKGSSSRRIVHNASSSKKKKTKQKTTIPYMKLYFVFCSLLSIIFMRDFQIKSIKSAGFIYYFFGTKNISHLFTEAMHSCLQLLYVHLS